MNRCFLFSTKGLMHYILVFFCKKLLSNKFQNGMNQSRRAQQCTMVSWWRVSSDIWCLKPSPLIISEKKQNYISSTE